MDGGSFSFEFQNGRLVAAISRGDGLVGEDITANALKFRGLPARCQIGEEPFTGYMRGEVILTIEDWAEQVDPDALSNPRNCCVGIARRKSGRQSELLQVLAFRVFDSAGHPLGATETEQTQIMQQMRFDCAPSFAGTPEEVWQWYLKTQKERPTLPYWIDGIVVKLDNISEQLALGETDQRPKGQVALKFEAEGAVSCLRGVTISVGHTGAVVPTASFDPVQIGGTTVTNATCATGTTSDNSMSGSATGSSHKGRGHHSAYPRSRRKSERLGQHPEPKCCPSCAGEVKRRSNVSGTKHGPLLPQRRLPREACGKDQPLPFVPGHSRHRRESRSDSDQGPRRQRCRRPVHAPGTARSTCVPQTQRRRAAWRKARRQVPRGS